MFALYCIVLRCVALCYVVLCYNLLGSFDLWSFTKSPKRQQTITQKMVNQGRSDFYVVFTMSLRALGLKNLLISLLFQII